MACSSPLPVGNLVVIRAEPADRSVENNPPGLRNNLKAHLPEVMVQRLVVGKMLRCYTLSPGLSGGLLLLASKGGGSEELATPVPVVLRGVYLSGNAFKNVSAML